jgi:hypothetical protein
MIASRVARSDSLITAIGSTEGAVEKFLVSDVFKESPITRSVLDGFG